MIQYCQCISFFVHGHCPFSYHIHFVEGSSMHEQCWFKPGRLLREHGRELKKFLWATQTRPFLGNKIAWRRSGLSQVGYMIRNLDRNHKNSRTTKDNTDIKWSSAEMVVDPQKNGNFPRPGTKPPLNGWNALQVISRSLHGLDIAGGSENWPCPCHIHIQSPLQLIRKVLAFFLSMLTAFKYFHERNHNMLIGCYFSSSTVYIYIYI